MAKKKTEQDNIELVAGKRYTINEDTREAAKEKVEALKQSALSQGLTKIDGGAIQYIKKDYLDKGKFFVAIRFNP